MNARKCFSENNKIKEGKPFIMKVALNVPTMSFFSRTSYN